MPAKDACLDQTLTCRERMSDDSRGSGAHSCAKLYNRAQLYGKRPAKALCPPLGSASRIGGLRNPAACAVVVTCRLSIGPDWGFVTLVLELSSAVGN